MATPYKRKSETTVVLTHVEDGKYAELGPLGNPYSAAEHPVHYLAIEDYFALGKPERIEITVRPHVPAPTADELKALVS